MKARTNAAPAADEMTLTNDAITPDMTTAVSDEDTPLLLDRNTYKSIKKMERAALERLIQDIYESGRKKGLKEAGAEAGDDDSNALDLKELEQQIKAVKGVGEKRAEEIIGIIESWLGV